MIDLKVLHFSLTVPAGISAYLLSSKAYCLSLTLLILIVFVSSFLIGILYFLILRLTSLVVDLIIIWPVLKLALIIVLWFRKSGRS